MHVETNHYIIYLDFSISEIITNVRNWIFKFENISDLLLKFANLTHVRLKFFIRSFSETEIFWPADIIFIWPKVWNLDIYSDSSQKKNRKWNKIKIGNHEKLDFMPVANRKKEKIIFVCINQPKKWIYFKKLWFFMWKSPIVSLQSLY